MKKHRKCKKIIIAFVTVLFIAFVAVIGLHKTGIYRFDFLKDIYKKIDFQLSTNELNIPQDALSFSVYDIEQEEYLFYEGDSQLPTVASLAKLFAIDYALGKVDLEDIVEVNQEVLELVPAGSSLANLYAGEYTVKQIMEAMLVPSGNDAAYVLAYHIGNNVRNTDLPHLEKFLCSYCPTKGSGGYPDFVCVYDLHVLQIPRYSCWKFWGCYFYLDFYTLCRPVYSPIA